MDNNTNISTAPQVQPGTTKVAVPTAAAPKRLKPAPKPETLLDAAGKKAVALVEEVAMTLPSTQQLIDDGKLSVLASGADFGGGNENVLPPNHGNQVGHRSLAALLLDYLIYCENSCLLFGNQDEQHAVSCPISDPTDKTAI